MYTSQVELCSSIVVLDARQDAKPIVFICREQNLILFSTKASSSARSLSYLFFCSTRGRSCKHQVSPLSYGSKPQQHPPHKICIGQRSLHGCLWMGWVGILKPSVWTQQRAFKGSLITSCALSLGGVGKMGSWRDEHNYLSGAGRSQEPRFVAYWYRFILLLSLPEALNWSPINFPHFGSLSKKKH